MSNNTKEAPKPQERKDIPDAQKNILFIQEFQRSLQKLEGIGVVSHGEGFFTFTTSLPKELCKAVKHEIVWKNSMIDVILNSEARELAVLLSDDEDKMSSLTDLMRNDEETDGTKEAPELREEPQESKDLPDAQENAGTIHLIMETSVVSHGEGFFTFISYLPKEICRAVKQEIIWRDSVVYVILNADVGKLEVFLGDDEDKLLYLIGAEIGTNKTKEPVLSYFI
jgi:hypothetical protein